jgi:hypothetical protein
VAPAPGGGFYAHDERSGATVVAPDMMAVHEFAADSAVAPGRMGAGDVVARAASALGIGKCTPCAARQAALNRLIPNTGFRRH